MKSVFLIAIVAVAMIGVMVPSAFAVDYTLDETFCTQIGGSYTQDRICTLYGLLTVNAGNTLTIPAMFIVEGNINNDGTIINYGVFGSKGTLTNNGSINNEAYFSNTGIIHNYGTISNEKEFGNTGDVHNYGTIINNEIIKNLLLQSWDVSGKDGVINNYGTIINNEIIKNLATINNYAIIENIGTITDNDPIESTLTPPVVEDQSVPVVEEQSVPVVEEKGGGCLIATATYGSELAPQVQQLRELRDNQLLNTASGSAFMSTFNDVYYSFSPIIADYERENPYFKEAVKLAITPMISSLSLMENAESESEVLSIGISVIALNLGMYLGIPATVVIGLRRII